MATQLIGLPKRTIIHLADEGTHVRSKRSSEAEDDRWAVALAFGIMIGILVAALLLYGTLAWVAAVEVSAPYAG